MTATTAGTTRTTRRSLSLSGAARVFWRYASPWLIATTLVATTVARGVVGAWMLTDLVVAVVMVASFPLVEWLVHTSILHWRPRAVAGLTIDPLAARKHREHHADPRDTKLVFLPVAVLLTLLAIALAVGLLAFPRLGLGLTFLVTLGAIGLVYEWMHYLVHSDYRPKRSLYRAIWRNHRLHHYKNEQYWFTLTTCGTADRVFGTYPNPADVETSPTCHDLLGEAA